MNILYFFLGSVTPYIALLVFLIGMIYRIYTWAKMPSPIITLYPKPKNSGLMPVLKDVFLFPGLLKSDKSFWGGAWIFHVALAFIFIGHFRVVMDFPWLWNLLGMNEAAVDKMSAISGGIAGIIIMAAALYLIFRRISLQRVREISGLSDYLIMFLILGIVLTGNAMRFYQHFDLNLTRAYFAGLITLSGAQMPVNGLFVLHFTLAQMLIILVPFSKILHLGGIFFSQTILKRS